MPAKKKAVKVKKYKSVQSATKARTDRGSVASRRVSSAVNKGSRVKRGGGSFPALGGAGSLGDLIIRTINGVATPINGSSNKKKKK